MHLLRDTSISRKLKVVILLTTSVALLVASAAFVAYDLIAFRQSMASDLSTLAKVIGTNSTAALAFDDRGSAKDVLSALTAKHNIVRARIYTSDSELFAEYVRDGESGDLKITVQQQSQVAFTDGYLIASETIGLDSENIGTVYLISNLDAFRSRFNRYAGVVAAVLFGSLLVAFLLSSKLQSLISDPISHLAKTVRAVSVDKDYTLRAVKHGSDEMGMLIDGFNEMLSQIQERDAKLQSARDELEQRVEERTKELQDEIAERKQAVELLRRSEEHFRSLIENASDVITIVDRKGTILYESPSVERVLGLKPKILIGANALDLTHPDDRKTAVALLTVAMKEGRPAEPFELRFKHADGSWRTLEVIGQLVRDESGAIEVIINSRDVTERKRSEAALRESEEKYRTILESIQEGYYEVDLRGHLTFFNDSLCRIVGTPPDKLKGLNHREYADPDTAGMVFEAFNRVFSTGKSIEGLQYQITNLEGVTRFLEVSVSLRRESTGEIAGFRGTIRDVTERQQAEQALRESEERYKTLFESATDSIMVLATEEERRGRILAANRAAAEHTGYTVEELLDLNLADLQTQGRTELTSREFQRIVQGESLSVELLRVRKDGTTFPIEVNAAPLKLGANTYILSFARDLTQRKRIENEVTMLAHAVRSIQEAVCITDAEDILLFVNDAFLETYGYERHEVMGKKIFELVRVPANLLPDTPAIPPPNLIRRWEGEILNRRKDGTVFPIHLSTSPIFDETGRTIALVGVTQDITERRHAIEELQKAKEAAEAASGAKSEFLANMSHEIRTPMNGIIGMTELALDTELSTEQREYLKMVKLSADSLLGVINDVLDFSKIEAGRLELDPAEFDLQDAVDEVMKALAVRADQKGLELAYYLRPGVPERVVGDVGRLRQVLVNLVGNAIKFTERGEVIVRVEAEAQTTDEVVLHFGVRDTGIGIPPGKETMIFESFTQADGSTTRKYGGTGLGLTISSQLVHMMGGEIWVESPVNLPSSYGTPGSLFQFTGTFALPLDSVTHPPEMFDLEGLPVLVVDDNATNRRILEVQLTNWQMKPALVEGSRSALRAIEHAASAGAPFKLALLDFHMPEMDGLALAELIKSVPEGRDLRIIMMSSSVQQNQASPRDCSVDASLLKPVKAAELLSVIRVVLGADPRSQTQRRQAGRKSAYPSRVLVAEDSTINQELIRRLLEKWGHTALIAENGLKALSLFDTEMFDLVLMDLQMPEMNGFEVTAAIRQRERGAGTRIPIIALTAHALKGDRERCIGAGMDDYVSKPVDAGRLFGAVETAAIRRGSARSNCEIVPKALDLDGLLQNLDGDSDLVLTLARVFADSSLSQVEQIGDAIARGDAEALASGAHLLKGSVANFGARAAVDAAVQLEGIAKSGDLSIAGSAFATLEKEIDRLKRELQMFEQASML